MKVYKIKVNGKTYNVELEAVDEVKSAASASVPVASAPAKSNAPAPVASEGDKQVVAPLQGTLTAIKVNVGDTVKKGQTVAIIEAMKLENEVSSPFDGVVTAVVASKGAAVATKDVLLTLK